jgi:hypothetical protein
MKRVCLLFALVTLLGCGDFVFFVSFNAGPIDPNGLVVVIGTVQDPPPAAVSVVEGTIPRGMQLMPDGTVQGIPEERGVFEFTLEFTHQDGSIELQPFTVELNEN